MLNFFKPIILPCAVAFIAVGCDSSTPLEVASIGVDLDLSTRGIDFEEALANPTDIAMLPQFYLASDVIEHDAVQGLTDRGTTQFSEGVLNSAGQLTIDSLSLTWERSAGDTSNGTFTLSESDSFPVNDSEASAQFVEALNSVIAGAAGTTGGINQALTNNFSDENSQIIADAVNTAGFVSVVGPETFIGDTVLQPLVLLERTIEYTVTSTNQELIDNGVISGTFDYVDRWARITLFSSEFVGNALEFDQVILDTTDIAFLNADGSVDVIADVNDPTGVAGTDGTPDGNFTIRINQ